MKLYINGLFYKGSGIGRYYESLLKELANKGLTIYTSVPKKLQNDWIKQFNGFKNIIPIFVDYEKFSIRGFYTHGKILKKLEKDVDVFFFPHINLPKYVPLKTIVTIHDLRPLTKWWDRGKIKRKIYTFFLRRALYKSRKIISVSYATKNEIVKFFKNFEEKIEVIYNFIDEKFLKAKKNEDPLIKENYFLFVGNRKKHKNLVNLILAYNKIKDKIDGKLVIVGSRDTKGEDDIDKLIKNLNLKNYVIQFPFSSDDTLINLYTYSKLFVFPSFYEGFGYPPLEAIACNCPAICSKIPVLKEILGEKIACFDPSSIEDIAEKILKIWENKEKQIELLKEGKIRLKNYHKDKIVNQYIKLFQKESAL